MTEHDDKLSRRYRELAREEPSASVDATILARARRRAPGHRRSWFVPVSIAAVLMLGVGVTLRMQMEEPGIETSAPKRELPVRAPESPPAEAPAPQPQLEAKAKSRLASPARPAAAPVPMQERADASSREEDSTIAMPGAPGPIAPPAANFVPSPPPAAAPPAAAANRAAPAVMRDQVAPAARSESAPAAAGAVGLQLAEPQRAKQEAEAFAAKELKKSVALPERDAELERIAKLRESGKHADADRALEEFRKRYPDFRIPEAMWERVRPR
jgi:hypothetical protein